jgi:hypothetical protein
MPICNPLDLLTPSAMNRSSVLYLLIAASLAVPGTAFSQWQWKDTNGRTVYSDTPPPPSVPDRAIIMAPGRAPGMYHAVEADAPPKGDAPAKADAPRMQPTSVKAGGTKPKDADTEFQERRDARLRRISKPPPRSASNWPGNRIARNCATTRRG